MIVEAKINQIYSDVVSHCTPSVLEKLWDKARPFVVDAPHEITKPVRPYVNFFHALMYEQKEVGNKVFFAFEVARVAAYASFALSVSVPSISIVAGIGTASVACRLAHMILEEGLGVDTREIPIYAEVVQVLDTTLVKIASIAFKIFLEIMIITSTGLIVQYPMQRLAESIGELAELAVTFGVMGQFYAYFVSFAWILILWGDGYYNYAWNDAPAAPVVPKDHTAFIQQKRSELVALFQGVELNIPEGIISFEDVFFPFEPDDGMDHKASIWQYEALKKWVVHSGKCPTCGTKATELKLNYNQCIQIRDQLIELSKSLPKRP